MKQRSRCTEVRSFVKQMQHHKELTCVHRDTLWPILSAWRTGSAIWAVILRTGPTLRRSTSTRAYQCRFLTATWLDQAMGLDQPTMVLRGTGNWSNAMGATCPHGPGLWRTTYLPTNRRPLRTTSRGQRARYNGCSSRWSSRWCRWRCDSWTRSRYDITPSAYLVCLDGAMTLTSKHIRGRFRLGS